MMSAPWRIGFVSKHTGGFLILLVVFGFLLRLTAFDITASSVFDVDVARDYLISSHILAYHDLPLVGPDGYFGPQSNSPVYFYIVALLLLIHNSVLFPGLVNVFLQSCAILLVYSIGRELFGKQTGLLAAFVYTIFDPVVAESVQMWQPHLSSFFMLLSFVLLIYSYKKKSSAALYISVILFCLSAVIHNSMFVIAPVYVLALYKATVSFTSPKVHLLRSLFFSFVVFALSYASVAYHFFYVFPFQAKPTTLQQMYLPPPLPLSSPVEMFVHTIERTPLFFSYFFSGTATVVTLWSFLCIVVCGAGFYAYFLLQTDLQKKKYLFVLLLMCFLDIVGVGSLSLYTESDFPFRYYIPIFAPLLIACAECAIFFVRRCAWRWRSLLLLLIVMMVGAGSWHSFESISRMPERSATVLLYGLPYAYDTSQGEQTLVQTIKQLSAGQQMLIPFDIRTFENGAQQLYKSELVWLSLENTFGVQLVHLDTTKFRGYAPVQDPRIMFIQCIGMEVAPCESAFIKKYGSEYTISGTLYQSAQLQYVYAHRI